MRELENDCVGCPQGCIHCGRNRNYYKWTCDRCGKQTTDGDEFFHLDQGSDYCPDCYSELVEKEGEE